MKNSADANKRAQPAKAQASSGPTSAATSYLCQVPLCLFFDLMLVHLQKILFTADEAHRASHPSEARPGRIRPAPNPSKKLPPPLASLRARSSSSAAQIWRLNSAHMGDKCAVWHRRDVRPTRRTTFGASLRCSHDALLQPDWGEATSPRGGAAGNALLWQVPNVHLHVWKYIGESELKGHEHGLS